MRLPIKIKKVEMEKITKNKFVAQAIAITLCSLIDELGNKILHIFVFYSLFLGCSKQKWQAKMQNLRFVF